MIAAFLTTILFSISGASAMRTTRYLPSLEANFWRLLVATGLLALYAHTLGVGVRGPALGGFLLSGLVGFGFGDIALYLAYPRLGSRLVILIVHCVASPLAAAVEWLWLGVPMTGIEILASSLILSGVAGALAPVPSGAAASQARTLPGAGPSLGDGRRLGIAFALVAATGQGIGAVLSRRAFEVARLAGQPVDGISAAYQRIIAGVILSAISFLIFRRLRGSGRSSVASATSTVGATGGGGTGVAESVDRRRVLPWLMLNAFAGPALGVSCFQWALAERGTGVVLPIVALTPLTIIPFSMWLEGERPSRRSLVGGVVAVAGAVLHAVTHAAR